MSTLIRRPYDNYQIFHPDGTLMSYCSSKKANWYAARNLANLVDNEVHLTFEPNGYGDPIDILEGRNNYCVITKSEHDLTKHHVIPTQFRKHLEPQYKDKNSTDIVVLTRESHDAYELSADVFKEQLYNDCIDEPFKDRIKALYDVHSKYNSLTKHYNHIPPAKQVYLQMRIEGQCEKYNISVTDEIDGNMYDKMIVDKIGQINIIVLWKLHFIKYGNPKFLPTWWKPNMIKVINHKDSIKNKTDMLKVDMSEPTLLELIKKYDLYEISRLYI